MICRDRAVVFAHFLWHNSAVPVFLERFILPAFAATVVLLAVANPMKFDTTQRVTGVIALIFAAYFVAHTVYKAPQNAQSPLSADVRGAIWSTNMFWVLFNTDQVSGVDVVLRIILVNSQGTPAALNSMLVEIKTPDSKWMRLKRIPRDSTSSYFGPANNAAPAIISPDDIFQVLATKGEIGPGETVRGVCLFEYADHSFGTPQGASATFRITLEDSLRRTSVSEVPPRIASGNPHGSVDTWTLQMLGNVARQDLTRLHILRFYP